MKTTENTETKFVDFDTTKNQLDAFTTDVVSTPRKLDADQYNVDDIDGGTEDLFGSGNLNYLTLQMGQTNDVILSHSPFVLLNQNEGNFLKANAQGRGETDGITTASSSSPVLSSDTGFTIQDNIVEQSSFTQNMNAPPSVSGSMDIGAGSGISAGNMSSSSFFSNSSSSALSSLQTGKDGQNGTNGTNGENGTNGSNGNDGNDGNNGNDGNHGNNGNDGIDGVVETITDTVSCTVTNVINLLEQIIQIVNNTVEHITNVTEHVIGDTINIIDVVTDVVGGTVNEVTDIVDDVLDGSGDLTGDIINVANDTVDCILNSVVDDTVDHLLDTVDGIVSHLPIVNALPTGEIFDGVSNLVDDVTDVTTTLVGDATGIVDTLVDNVTDNTGNIIETVGETVDTLLNETVDDTAEALLGTVGDILNGDIFEGNLVENVFDNIEGIIPDALHTLGDSVNDIVCDGTAVVNGVTDVVKGDVFQTVDNVLDGTLGTVGNLLDNLGNGLGNDNSEGNGDYDLLADVDLDIVNTDILDIDVDAILDPVEMLLGDIDIDTDAGLNLFGGQTSNAQGDSDVVVDIGIAGLDLDLHIPLDPVETILGDIDLGVDVSLDLLGLGTESGPLDILDPVIAWPETTVQNLADTLLGGDILGGDLGHILPDPIGNVVEGLGLLDIGSHNGGGGLLGGAGLFGGGLFG